MAKRSVSGLNSGLQWLLFGAITVIVIFAIYAFKTSLKSPVLTEIPVSASQTQSTYYTSFFTLKYPGNWFADEIPNDNDVTRFYISDLKNSPKLRGKSDTHARILVNYINGPAPRCYTTDGYGKCIDIQNKPYSINGYSGFYGEQTVQLGDEHIVYLKNPNDQGQQGTGAYLSLILVLPTKENTDLSQRVFNDIVSSVNFKGTNQASAPPASQISNPSGQVGNAHLDLFAKSVSVVMDATSLSVNNKNYLTNINNFSLYSDPTSSSSDGYSYTTLETAWNENGVEMRIYFYFRYKPTQDWEMYDLRTFNGADDGEWIHYPVRDSNGNPIVHAPSGNKFVGYDLTFNSNTETLGKLHFGSLTIDAFRDLNR